MTRRRRVTIRERGGLWTNEATGRVHRSGALALRAVRDADRRFVRANPGALAITTIEWDTETALGAAVAKALGGSRAARGGGS